MKIPSSVHGNTKARIRFTLGKIGRKYNKITYIMLFYVILEKFK